MATFISLFNFTEQGVSKVKASPDRADAFRKIVKKAGGKVRDTYWTMGHHDGVLIFDAPDDETATRIMLSLAARGNVRTETLRAFDSKEFTKIVKDI